MAYLFTIDSTAFYAVTNPDWKPYGVQQGFSNDGRPSTYGPGSFSIVLGALAYTTPTAMGGDFATSGTHAQLFALWRTALSSNNGVQSFNVFDPRTNAYITVTGRMKPPVQLAGGAAIAGVRIEVYNAFISAAARSTYYLGDPNPITTTPAYIPGDPLPAGTAGKTYGWNKGRYGYGLWGQGEGV